MRETVHGVKTHYVFAGEGEPLIMIHGGGPGASGSSGWANTIPDLAKHFRVYAIDLIGNGQSDKPLVEYSFQTQVEHCFRVAVDPPAGIIFFRAFHQLRRYETDKYGPNPRLGLTNINQGTREYGIIQDNINVYVGVLPAHAESVTFSLTNRDHLGTHDSLCSLVGAVERCGEPQDVIFRQRLGKLAYRMCLL